MTSANHIPQDDLYLFAMQLLSESEMQTIAQHLNQCSPCKATIGDIQGDLAGYALSTEMQAPRPETRERLLRQVALEKKIIPIDRREAVVTRDQHIEPVLTPRSSSRMFQMEAPEERPRRRVAPFFAWTGWAAAASAAVFAGMQFQQRKADEQAISAQTAKVNDITSQTAEAKRLMQALTDANAMQVSLHVPLTAGAAPKMDPEAHATYVPGKGSLVFVASHLDPLPPDKTYELWLLPSEPGKSPIPAGLFKPDVNGNATVVMPPLPKEIAAKGFGVTVEADGGSQTPTAPIVLAGM